MRKPALREAGILPKGGILRLYGRAISSADRAEAYGRTRRWSRTVRRGEPCRRYRRMRKP